jgi:hypothetical protein
MLYAALLGVCAVGAAQATPYVPARDSQVIAELPAGARHSNAAARDLTRSRLDIALPMAQFYLSRARATGDLRFLGYAEAILVVKQILGQYKVKEPRLQALHGQVIMLLNAVKKFKFRHVRREDNTRADELANEALDAVG